MYYILSWDNEEEVKIQHKRLYYGIVPINSLVIFGGKAEDWVHAIILLWPAFWLKAINETHDSWLMVLEAY